MKPPYETALELLELEAGDLASVRKLGLETAVDLSIAISLKRIADQLEQVGGAGLAADRALLGRRVIGRGPRAGGEEEGVGRAQGGR